MNRGTPKTKRPIRAFAALLAVGALALSACGSSGSNGKATESDDTTVTSGDTGSEPAADKLGADCPEIPAPAEGDSSGDWELKISSTPGMLQELATSLENCEPIIVTLWRPHWAYDAYSVKDLEDPEGSMGEGEEIWGTANKDWAADNPELVDALKKFSLDDDQLASLENFVLEINADEPEKGVDEWLADGDNQATADAWTEGLEGGGDSVTIGFIAWDEDIAVTHLWENLLTEAGYDVETTELDVGPLFSGMASGDVDFFLDTWLPATHADYWDEFGDKLEKLSDWYEGEAILTIAVPTYMDIDSIDQIKNWGDEVNDEIIGIDPGAGLTRTTQCIMMPDYGLAEKPDASECES